MSYIVSTSRVLLSPAPYGGSFPITSGTRLLGSREAFTGQVPLYQRPFLPMAEARSFSGGLR